MPKFTIVFNDQKLTFDRPVSLLEIVGNNKDIVCHQAPGSYHGVRRGAYTRQYQSLYQRP